MTPEKRLSEKTLEEKIEHMKEVCSKLAINYDPRSPWSSLTGVAVVATHEAPNGYKIYIYADGNMDNGMDGIVENMLHRDGVEATNKWVDRYYKFKGEDIFKNGINNHPHVLLMPINTGSKRIYHDDVKDWEQTQKKLEKQFGTSEPWKRKNRHKMKAIVPPDAWAAFETACTVWKIVYGLYRARQWYLKKFSKDDKNEQG